MHVKNLKKYLDKSNSTIRERFWKKVKKTSTCWLWTGAKYGGNYGAIGIGFGQGNAYAHRISYLLTGRIIPKGKIVCHKCDNPPCVNPEHLFISNHAGNNADCRAKGRHAFGNRHGSKTKPDRWARGERIAQSKLTAADVKKIRELFSTGEYTQVKLGEMYGVNPRSAIYDIVHRRTWRHV